MAKKKKKAPRKISKTEKQLRGKLSYRNSKIKKMYAQMNEQIFKLEKLKPFGEKKFQNKKVKTYRATDEVKKILGRKGKVIVHKQTIIDAYFSKIYKIRNETNKIEDTLSARFNKRIKERNKLEKKKGEFRIELGLVWQIDREIQTELISNKQVKKVEGLNKKSDLDLILDKINEEKLSMDSKMIMYLVGKDDFKIQVVNKDFKP